MAEELVAVADPFAALDLGPVPKRRERRRSDSITDGTIQSQSASRHRNDIVSGSSPDRPASYHSKNVPDVPHGVEASTIFAWGLAMVVDGIWKWRRAARSGKLASRPELDACLASLQPGDVLIVIRLSRLARSMRNLLNLIELLRQKDAALKVLKQDIDTSTPTGRLVFHVLAVIDEFQRELIVENTEEGLKAAAARGARLGASQAWPDGRSPSRGSCTSRARPSLRSAGY